MLNRILAVVSLVVLVACGSGDSTPSAPSTPVPTPIPVSYTGSFSSGTMTHTDEFGVFGISSTVSVTHQGSSLNLGGLQITSPFVVTYPLGAATLTGDHFDGRSGYNSVGCGTATSHYVGYFSGDGRIMNLTVTLNFSDNRCGTSDIRGEMRR